MRRSYRRSCNLRFGGNLHKRKRRINTHTDNGGWEKPGGELFTIG